MPFVPTEEQKRVILHPFPSHARVLAGPGTGKSATAVALAEHALAGDSPLRIRFITFTRAATAELAHKLASSPADLPSQPATFHSFAIATVVRNPGCASFPHPLRIPDDWEQEELIFPHLAAKLGVKKKKLKKLVDEMAAKWESLADTELSDVTPGERARFHGAWHEHRTRFGYTLMAELPDLLRQALRDHDDLQGLDLDALIVDEYQDLNACELEVLARLSGRGVVIVAIGDDDQSIYSWRKAHPAGIRQFCASFQPSADYKLTICHRSQKPIVEWGQFIIAGDTGRAARPPLVSAVKSEAGCQTRLLAFANQDAEATGVAELVRWLVEVQQVEPSQILVLARTDNNGTFSSPVKAQLAACGIPVSDPDAISTLLAEPSHRRLLALLRLKSNLEDSLAWWTLVRLEAGLGQAFMEWLVDAASSANTTVGITIVANGTSGFDIAPSSLRSRAKAFFERVIGELLAFDPSDREPDGGWGAWIVQNAASGGLPGISPDLGELLVALDETSERAMDLGPFVSQIEPHGRDLASATSKGVRFMRMVASKGLTVRATVLMGAEKQLIPRRGENLQEERRLLYVAMTRASQYLFLTWARRRTGPTARANFAQGYFGQRQPTEFLRGGPVESTPGEPFVASLIQIPAGSGASQQAAGHSTASVEADR